ncbi:MAG: hypothetical protein JKX83_00985 [Pseudomonadales bacterium]|nr:hypothetical protein [Pseudomonadales bacterium]
MHPTIKLCLQFLVRFGVGGGFYLRHHWLKCAALLAVVVSAFAATYQLGLVTGTQYSERAAAETRRLRAEVLVSVQDIETQSLDLGRLRARAKLNAQSEKLVRTEMIQLTHRLVQLQKENSIFRKVMDPESFEKGLSIRSWDVKPSALLHHFKFELVIQQLASRHPLVNGSVIVEISGVEDGEQRTIGLSRISEQFSKRKIKLRFRYFQEIRGEMVLPPRFIPETVHVIARSRGKRPQTREKSFEWMPVEL